MCVRPHPRLSWNIDSALTVCRKSPACGGTWHSPGRVSGSCLAHHIVPTIQGLPPTHSEPHERNAKKIVDTLRKTYGNGNLLDPMGMCVISDPQRYLVAGEYTFGRNPEGEL